MIALTRRLVPLIGCSVASFVLACGRSFKSQVPLSQEHTPKLHSPMNLASMEIHKLPSSLGSRYYLHPDIQGFVDNAPGDTNATALPVIVLSALTWSKQESLLQALQRFRTDDVFCDDFVNGNVVVFGSQEDESVALQNLSLTGIPSTIMIFKLKQTLKGMPQPANPPEEPYFLLGDRLHQAWKLYPDTLDSFATTVILTKSEPSGFQILGKTTEDGLWSTVAAPSRLYSTPSKELPLAGMRVSVKDNFCLKGIKTTQSNRAFVDTYGPETETAAYLKKLINLGAVIVGKTKLCAFASSEEATDQWIDFHPPFNPRADGYQSPSGSTSGGATSLAGYQWLDFSIGTDTSGSVRWPAAWNGLFGLRVTTNATSLDGVYAACRKMDTVGLLSRDLSSLHDFAQHTIEKTSGDIKTFPKRLLYSTDFFPHSNKIQQTIVEEYVTVLENFLDVKRIEFIIADRWAQCPPAEAEGKPLKEFLNKTAFNPFYWDGYHEFDQFREDHETKFGKKVYVGPYMRWKWEMGASVTEDEVKQSLGEWAVYEQWFHDTIFQEDPECGSTAVMVLPCGTSAPKYRDDPNSPPGIVPAFSPNYIASMIGLPQLVLPIGQFPYESRVSGRVEYLPAVGTLVGAKGSDLMLVNLAKAALEDAKWPTEVLTGRFTFKPGEGSRNVAHLDNTGPSHL